MTKIRKNIAQSAVEYSLIIAVVVSALVTINVYVKRGLQGRMADAGDDFANTVRDAPWPADSGSAVFQRQFEDNKISKSVTTFIEYDKENFKMIKGGSVNYSTGSKMRQQEGDYYRYDP